MARFLRRVFRYASASANAKFDERADPKIQIQQAIEEAQRQHAQLSQQAAAVIGNQRQLEMRMGRALEETHKFQESARQALVLADQARQAGDEAKAASYEQAAQSFATQLISTERSMNDMKALHEQAVASAEAARRAVEQNSLVLQQKLTERSQLLTQLEHAKMQEQMSKALSSVSSLNVPGDVPSLEEVRNKIESRYATALGSADIASNTPEARMLEVQKAGSDAAAAARLAQIRASLGSGSAGDTPAIEQAGEGG